MPLPRLKLIDSKPKQTNALDWNQLISSIDRLKGRWRYGDIIDLDGWSIIQYKETINHVFALTEFTTKAVCPCGSEKGLKKHGFTRAMKLLDLPFHGKFTEIHYRARRFKCVDCGEFLQQPVPERHEDHNLTARLVSYIEEESLYPFNTFFDISLKTGVNACVIKKIFNANVKRLEKGHVVITPRYFTIDELHLSTRKNVRCVITAPEEKKVLELLENNGVKTIRMWMEQLPDSDRVEAVSMDMCSTYLSIVRKALPKAVIVADRYHVQNILNVALKETLDVIRSSLTVTQHRKIMRREELLLKNRHCLGKVRVRKGLKIIEPEKQQVEAWLETNPLLAIAYNLKEGFSDILQLNDRQVAEERMDKWLEQLDLFVENFQRHYEQECKKLSKYPFRNVIVSFRTWRQYILNYIDLKTRFSLKVTNAFAEFANKQIKKAYAIGNGYKHEILRAKLVHGGLLKKKMPANPLENTSSLGTRKRVKTESPVKTSRNPNADVAQIKKVRLANDKMIGLVPKPQDNQGFASRFIAPDPAEKTSPLSINFGIKNEDEEKPDLLIYNTDEKDFSKKKNKRTKSDQNHPPPLFQFFEEKTF